MSIPEHGRAKAYRVEEGVNMVAGLYQLHCLVSALCNAFVSSIDIRIVKIHDILWACSCRKASS